MSEEHPDSKVPIDPGRRDFMILFFTALLAFLIYEFSFWPRFGYLEVFELRKTAPHSFPVRFSESPGWFVFGVIEYAVCFIGILFVLYTALFPKTPWPINKIRKRSKSE
jgi:hypothetical protein